MRENLTSGSMRGGWNRSSEAQTTYAPAGNRRGTLVGPLAPRASRLLHRYLRHTRLSRSSPNPYDLRKPQ
jgi:hypothetical protein